MQRHTEGTEYTRLMRARRFVVLALAYLLVASAAAAQRVDRAIDGDTLVSRDARRPHSRIDRDAEAGKKLGLK